jgi:hypothetical protein
MGQRLSVALAYDFAAREQDLALAVGQPKRIGPPPISLGENGMVTERNVTSPGKL